LAVGLQALLQIQEILFALSGLTGIDDELIVLVANEAARGTLPCSFYQRVSDGGGIGAAAQVLGEELDQPIYILVTEDFPSLR